MYQARQFIVPNGMAGAGNYLADLINQFLSFNPTVSPVTLSVSWREGRSKADQLTANLIYRLNGPVTRFWAFEVGGTSTAQPEDTLNTFLGLNPTYLPVIIEQTGSQALSNRWRKLLVIVADTSFATLGATHRGTLGVSAALAAATYGTFYDPTNTARPAVAGLNLGNGAWPVGGVNWLASALSNNPDYNQLGGIAPLCQTQAFTPPTQAGVSQFVGCFPALVATTTGTGTTTSTTTTTTSTSTTTTTTTSTTSTTTTSTTSTTTTSTSTTTTSGAVSPCVGCAGTTQGLTVAGTAGACAGASTAYTFASFASTGADCTWTYTNSNGWNLTIEVQKTQSGGGWNGQTILSQGATVRFDQIGTFWGDAAPPPPGTVACVGALFAGTISLGPVTPGTCPTGATITF